MDIVSHRFNGFFTYRRERAIDFLKLHYLLSRPADSAFRTDHRRAESVPDHLRDLLLLWRHLPPSSYDSPRVEVCAVRHGVPSRGRAQLTRKMLGALPSNRDLIDHIRKNGLQPI